MSSDTIILKASVRSELGKAAKRLRKVGITPANMYERGKESQAISAPFTDITKVYHQAGKHHPVQLEIDGKKHLTMIKDVDVDPTKGSIRHISFHAIKIDEVVTAEVPVRIDGEIPAERASLMVLHTLDTVEIKALPADLPDELIIDGAKLVEVGDKVTVADLQVPSGVIVVTEADYTLAVVEEPKDQIAEADAAAAELAEENAEGAEAEVPAENGELSEETENSNASETKEN